MEKKNGFGNYGYLTDLFDYVDEDQYWDGLNAYQVTNVSYGWMYHPMAVHGELDGWYRHEWTGNDDLNFWSDIAGPLLQGGLNAPRPH